MSALKEGAIYYSWIEFEAALAAFCHQTNSRFPVYDCKAVETFNSRKLIVDRLPLSLKYKYIKLACERFGQPRHEGRGIRNKGSKKSGCGAHIAVAARKSDKVSYLRVIRMVSKHSNQCEMRRKQKQLTREAEDKIPVNIGSKRLTRSVTGGKKTAQQRQKLEPDYEDDDSMQEYNYDVKPMVVYSDDEADYGDDNVEQKPVPIFHVNENPKHSPTPMDPVSGEINTVLGNTANRNTAPEDNEDIKPLILADKPSLRALLLPAMALNFSQRVIHTET